MPPFQTQKSTTQTLDVNHLESMQRVQFRADSALDEEALPSEGGAAIDAAGEVGLRDAGAVRLVVGSAGLAIVGPLVASILARRDRVAPTCVKV